MLNADNKTITWPLQEMGRKDGANAVASGEGFSFNQLKQQVKLPFL